jgi:flagellar hook-basal body complex protein FliE
MDPISNISNIQPSLDKATLGKEKTDGNFLEDLKSFSKQVNQELQEADKMVQDFAAGKDYRLHEIMIATEKAGLSFKLLMQVRGKLLEAYKEIMRITM